MTLTVNNVALHYAFEGAGPALTFVHSLGTNLSMWDPQVRAFSSGFSVLRYDVRGHGKSSVPPGPYSVEQMADDLYGLLVELRIARTHLVGIAMGGMIAMALALKHPDVVTSLVLSDTTSRYGPDAARGVKDRSRIVETQGMAAVVGPLLERVFTAGFRERHPETADRVRDMFVGTDPKGFIWSSQAIASTDLYEQLPSIGCPALVIVGDQDKATPVEMAKMIVDQIPRAELVILEAASHLSSLEQPDAFNRAVLAFLDRVRAA
jgi:3-oxoadipate enol-lactonase